MARKANLIFKKNGEKGTTNLDRNLKQCQKKKRKEFYTMEVQ